MHNRNKNVVFFTALFSVLLNARHHILVSHTVLELLAWLLGSANTAFHICFLKHSVKKVNIAVPTYNRNIFYNIQDHLEV